MGTATPTEAELLESNARGEGAERSERGKKSTAAGSPGSPRPACMGGSDLDRGLAGAGELKAAFIVAACLSSLLSREMRGGAERSAARNRWAG